MQITAKGVGNLLACVLLTITGPVLAQGLVQQQSSPSIVSNLNSAKSPDKIWSQPGRADIAAEPDSARNVRAVNPREVVVDSAVLERVLSRAPVRGPRVAGRGRRAAPAFLWLPAPDGGYVRFSIERTRVLSQEMEAAYPEITTYSGYAVNDPATRVTLDLTPLGFHAQVLQPGGRWFIDPQFREKSNRYVSYHHASDHQGRQCLLEGNQSPIQRSSVLNLRSGDVQRSYRLAVATTGEYGQFFGTEPNTVAAVTTTINRVTGIYEKELAITFTLTVYPFIDPVTDPFTGNNDAFTLINESQTVLDSVAGTLNYDVGHTLSTGAGGLAGLGVVCNVANKARGVTGSSNPTGDAFDVDFVAHEIGHQFSGNHTFNGAVGNCSGSNRNPSTAYEPGSGSTIQAYAGICGSDNLQSNSDAQMHIISHLEMLNHVENGSGAACGIATNTGNAIPTANAESDFVIPHSTPFLLVGSASDANADPLTYSWEQFDLGPQAALGTPDDGSIPLFRTLPPKSAPSRFFPDFNTVENGLTDPAEVLPALGRDMDFKLIARDGLGGVDSDDLIITVDGSSGPFQVTSPNGGESVSGSYLVTWDVAGTDGAPVSASVVDIVMSLTGSGLTYFENLAIDTPNDGSELIDFSSFGDVSNARIMIVEDASLGVHTFYDISDSTFSISAGPTMLTCNGLPVTVDLNLGQKPTAGPDVILGTPGDDTINGKGGDDTICGMDGADTISGGSGGDTIFGGDEQGNDTGSNIIYGASGNDIIYGGNLDDDLYGQSDDDTLYGMNGYDEIYGGSGADWLYSGNGAGVEDTFNDLYGGGGNDHLFGEASDDYLYGQGGIDYLETNNNSPSLQDQMWGGTGNDEMWAFGTSTGGSLMRGGDNQDVINGSDQSDDIQGNRGSDNLIGNGGDDLITGGNGRDFLFGGEGDDNLSGGNGNDAIDGGPHVVGDTCNGQNQDGGLGDTENDCEISSGFPRASSGSSIPASRSGRRVLTESEVELIDDCDLSVEQCLALAQR